MVLLLKQNYLFSKRKQGKKDVLSPNKSIEEGRFLRFEAVIGYLSSNQLACANKKKSRETGPNGHRTPGMLC